MKPAAALVAAVLLAAAAPPPVAAPGPAPAALPPGPEQWAIVPNMPNGSCGAKAPTQGGVDLDLLLSPHGDVSMILGSPGWKIEPRTYDLVVRLDDLAPFTFAMRGQGPGLFGVVPADFRAEFMTAGKIGFRFNETDYTIPVRNLSGVVARLQTCIDAKMAAQPGK